MSPMNHVDRRLLPPIFILNIGHNQSASRIVALTFLTENVSNESAFFVQRAHLYQAFLRNHTRTKFTAPTELLRSSYGAPTAPTAPTGLLRHQEAHLYLFSNLQNSQLMLSTTEQSLYSSCLVNLFL